MREQRRQTRLPFRAPSEFMVPATGRTFQTRVLGLSLKGALVEASGGEAPPPGTAGRLTLHLADEAAVSPIHAAAAAPPSLRLEVEVAHRNGGRLGLRCTGIDLDSLAHLRRLLELNLGDPNLLQREWRELRGA